MANNSARGVGGDTAPLLWEQAGSDDQATALRLPNQGLPNQGLPNQGLPNRADDPQQKGVFARIGNSLDTFVRVLTTDRENSQAFLKVSDFALHVMGMVSPYVAARSLEYVFFDRPIDNPQLTLAFLGTVFGTAAAVASVAFKGAFCAIPFEVRRRREGSDDQATAPSLPNRADDSEARVARALEITPQKAQLCLKSADMALHVIGMVGTACAARSLEYVIFSKHYDNPQFTLAMLGIPFGFGAATFSVISKCFFCAVPFDVGRQGEV